MLYKFITIISGFICFFALIEVGRILIAGGGFFTLCICIFTGFITLHLNKKWKNEDKVKLKNSLDAEKKSYENLVNDFEKNQTNINHDEFENTSYTIEMDEDGNLSKRHADFSDSKTSVDKYIDNINKDDLQNVIDKLEKHKK